MGFFKSSKKLQQVETTSIPRKVETTTRYVSPNLEKIPSDLSKNQVPAALRAVGNGSLSRLPPSANRIQAPYATNNEAESYSNTVTKESVL